MRKIVGLIIFLYSALNSYSQNAPFYLWGNGLDGSTYQKGAIFSDTENGMLFEAPVSSSNQRLPIEFNWRGGGTPAIRITSNSHIGIGTSNPLAKLHINGSDRLNTLFLQGTEPGIYYTNGIKKWNTFYSPHHVGFGIYEETVGLEDYRFFIKEGGNIGIGTVSPTVKLDVRGAVTVAGNSSNLDKVMPRNNLSFLANSGAMLIGWNRTAGDGETAFISNQGGGGKGGYAFYNYDNNNNETQLVRILGNGNVGIGTTQPDSKLTVAGKIHSQEVKVTINTGADYVFENKYQLKPLREIEQFVKENKHLPEIAPASKMEKEGVDLGEMNIKLLKKIEELTLYIIQQEKRIESLEKNQK